LNGGLGVFGRNEVEVALAGRRVEIRHRALIDAMGVDDDPARGGLPTGPMPRIIPEPRYFSIPSIELGAEVLRNRALNCWPWARSLIHSPDAVIHSPAEMAAA
jgi:hypothetical protein